MNSKLKQLVLRYFHFHEDILLESSKFLCLRSQQLPVLGHTILALGNFNFYIFKKM